MLKFCPLFSSSRGNSVYIGDNDGAILIDVGRSAKQTDLMLKNLDIDVDTIKGIFITHEHTDHVCGLRVFASKHNIPVYASPGTLCALRSKGILNEKIKEIPITCDDISVAGLNIKNFKISHDCADGRGYVVTGCDGSTKASVATDTGIVTNEILSSITTSKLIYIESNHDVEMLKKGPYPYSLQQRILSDKGHLSNELCAETIKALVNNGSTHFILAHLSQENNTPKLAFETTQNALFGMGALEGRDYILKTASPENSFGIVTI